MYVLTIVQNAAAELPAFFDRVQLLSSPLRARTPFLWWHIRLTILLLPSVDESESIVMHQPNVELLLTRGTGIESLISLIHRPSFLFITGVQQTWTLEQVECMRRHAAPTTAVIPALYRRGVLLRNCWDDAGQPVTAETRSGVTLSRWHTACYVRHTTAPRRYRWTPEVKLEVPVADANS